jgi:hypothetical protein
MNTIAVIAGTITALATLVWGVLKWWGGSGRLEKDYYDTIDKLNKKQDERTTALQRNDWHNFYLLNDECERLSKTADSLCSRLKSRGVIIKRP